MRRKEDRTTQILALLVQEKKIEVTELSAHLGVSQVTVRKDSSHSPQGSGRHGSTGPDHQRARLCSPVQHG